MSKFLDIINSPLLKTDEVTRYSGTYQINPEVLSVHIVDVQSISLIIAKNLQRNGDKVNIGELLEKGLLHDMDETLTGDFTRLVKYSSPECHDILEELAESVVREISHEVDGDDIINVWKSAKEHSTEGYIIRIADILSVCKKISREVDLLRNNNFLKVAVEVQSYLHSLQESIPTDLFSEKSVEYIYELLDGSIKYLEGIEQRNSSIIDQLNLMNSTIKRLIENRVRE